jgi:hypothetical protein
VDDPDDLDAVVHGAVEDEVLLEAFDPRDTQPGQAGMGRLPLLAG